MICFGELNKGNQRFVSGNISLEGRIRPIYSDLIAVKTGHFFGETTPQTFVARGLITAS